MAIRHYLSSGGSNLLPVSTNAEYSSPNMGAESYQYDVYIQFLDASSNPVTPTAGTVNVYGQPFTGMLLEADGSPVSAIDVSVGVAKYTPPTITGLSDKIIVKFTGITGAKFAKVCIYKKG